ncbi:metalloproteinase inhibitor 1 [Rhinatrema bivittatum]|uniref:metalloproteinase inhibitor 1 n=1 Tax=Rhinatrema bivittatum TaxID=194408 RepID=UPI00112B5FE8|nr:metalloproteinase inhibitor 1 [Rhinatrema bivittatum]
MDTRTGGFLAAALLLLAASGPSEACSCSPVHPQMAYCKADIVTKVRFVEATKLNLNNNTDGELDWIQYEIKPDKFFKGFDMIPNLQYVYTASQESLCGYNHYSTNKSEEYVIAGYIHEGKLRISSCSFIKPWAKLTASQKRGLIQLYKDGCGCNIVVCLSAPCSTSTDKDCLWTDYLTSQSSKAYQSQHYACLPQNSNACTWQSMKPRVASTAFRSRAAH